MVSRAHGSRPPSSGAPDDRDGEPERAAGLATGDRRVVRRREARCAGGGCPGYYRADEFDAPSRAAAPIAGMIVLPCSRRHGRRDRRWSSHEPAAEGRGLRDQGGPLVLVPRESPLSAIHLENLLRALAARREGRPTGATYSTRPRREIRSRPDRRSGALGAWRARRARRPVRVQGALPDAAEGGSGARRRSRPRYGRCSPESSRAMT